MRPLTFFKHPHSLQHTSRTPQPYPINRFQSSGGSSSGSGSGTPTPRPIHYLNSNTMGLDGINEITAPTSTNPKSSGEGGIGHEGDRPSFQGEGRWNLYSTVCCSAHSLLIKDETCHPLQRFYCLSIAIDPAGLWKMKESFIGTTSTIAKEW